MVELIPSASAALFWDEKTSPVSRHRTTQEGGEVFSSQNKAADALGIGSKDISCQLNGIKPDINGLHFERICIAA